MFRKKKAHNNYDDDVWIQPCVRCCSISKNNMSFFLASTIIQNREVRWGKMIIVEYILYFLILLLFRALAKHGLPKLKHLDLSGCLNVSADGLKDLVSTCLGLDAEELYYCDNITEGPYSQSASGCQNVECKNRVCCRNIVMRQ